MRLRVLATAAVVLAGLPATAFAAGFPPAEELGTGSFGTGVVAATDAAGTSTALLAGIPGGPVLRDRAAGAGVWSAAQPLGARGARGPVVAAAGKGALAIAWRVDTPRKYTGMELSWREPGGARVTPVRVADADANGVRHPALALDADGDVLLAYNTNTRATHLSLGGQIAIAIHRHGTTGVGAPVIVERDRTTAPVAALGPDGRGIVAWVRDHRVWAVSVDAAVGDVGTPQAVVRAQPLRNLAVAAGPDGAATLAWSASRGRQGTLNVVRRAPGADRFGAVQTVTRTSGWIAGLALGADADGVITVAWQEEDFKPRSILSSIHVAAASSRGSFGSARMVQPTTGWSCSDPDVASAARRVAVAWACGTRTGRTRVSVATGLAGAALDTEVVDAVTSDRRYVLQPRFDVGLDDQGAATIAFTRDEQPSSPTAPAVVRVLATRGA